jgi:hypothetical protein
MRTVWKAAVLGVSAALGTQTAAPAGAQTGFTGTVTYENHSQNGNASTLVEIQKGNKTRIELGGGQGAGIIDRDAGTMTVIMAAQKSYMTFPQRPVDQAAMGKQSTGDKLTFTNTGKTKIVAGVPCEIYHGTVLRNGKPEEGDACIAKGVGLNPLDFIGAPDLRGGMSPEIAALRDLLKDGRGVLEAITYHNGQPTVELEAKQIDRSTPSDAAFIPPADYHLMQMPQGMGAMGGMPGMAAPGGAKPPQ